MPLFIDMMLNGSQIATLNNAYFAGGTSTAQTYRYTDDTVTQAAALSRNFSNFSGAGTTEIAIFGGGIGNSTPFLSNTTNQMVKYTYATNTCAFATSITTARFGTGAAGTPTLGLWTGGMTAASVVLSSTEKYTYSGDSVSGGTALNVSKQSHGGAGNPTVGIFGYGNSYTVSTTKYTYSGDTTASASVFSVGRTAPATCGTSTAGYYAGGSPNATNFSATASVEKYTYSGDVVSSGTSLGVARYTLGGTGSGITGLIVGGVAAGGGLSNRSDKYTFASDSVVQGTNLIGSNYQYITGAGSTPGSFN
jgi:hypothetical protein